MHHCKLRHCSSHVCSSIVARQISILEETKRPSEVLGKRGAGRSGLAEGRGGGGRSRGRGAARNTVDAESWLQQLASLPEALRAQVALAMQQQGDNQAAGGAPQLLPPQPLLAPASTAVGQVGAGFTSWRQTHWSRTHRGSIRGRIGSFCIYWVFVCSRVSQASCSISGRIGHSDTKEQHRV